MIFLFRYYMNYITASAMTVLHLYCVCLFLILCTLQVVAIGVETTLYIFTSTEIHNRSVIDISSTTTSNLRSTVLPSVVTSTTSSISISDNSANINPARFCKPNDFALNIYHYIPIYSSNSIPYYFYVNQTFQGFQIQCQAKLLDDQRMVIIQKIPLIDFMSCLLECAKYNQNKPLGYNRWEYLCTTISVNKDFCFLRMNSTGYYINDQFTTTAALVLYPL